MTQPAADDRRNATGHRKVAARRTQQRKRTWADKLHNIRRRTEQLQEDGRADGVVARFEVGRICKVKLDTAIKARKATTFNFQSLMAAAAFVPIQ
jgi:hypothetical protein